MSFIYFLAALVLVLLSYGRIANAQAAVFDVEAKTLPQGFTGTEPIKIVTQFNQILSKAPTKVDSYSSIAEIAEYRQTLASRFDVLGLFPFVIDVYKNYDPDGKAFLFYLKPKSGTDGLKSLISGKRTFDDKNKIIVAFSRQELGKYIGSNTFGVKRSITRSRNTVIAIRAIAPKELRVQSATAEKILQLLESERVRASETHKQLMDKYFQGLATKAELDQAQNAFVELMVRVDRIKGSDVSVAIEPNEARLEENNIVCLILLKPDYPYIEEYSDSVSPTIDRPVDIEIKGTAIVGNIEQIWITNKRTGLVYLKCRAERPESAQMRC